MATVSASEIQSVGASKNPKLKAISDVTIEKNGKFKYILLKVHDPAKEREFKHIVRGSSKAEYHADIYDEEVPDIESLGLDCECVGGGRIEHEPNKKKIEIFGYSVGYGQANHSITAEIIRKCYTDIFDEVAPAIEDAGLDCECVGGGRIVHEPNKKKIEIHGHSQAYGAANHSLTARIISKSYREYDNITWNNDGY